MNSYQDKVQNLEAGKGDKMSEIDTNAVAYELDKHAQKVHMDDFGDSRDILRRGRDAIRQLERELKNAQMLSAGMEAAAGSVSEELAVARSEVAALKAETVDRRLFDRFVKTLDDYHCLINDELNELVEIAYEHHHWKSTRADKGKELRNKLAALRAQADKGGGQ